MKTKLFLFLVITLIFNYSYSQTWNQISVTEFTNDVSQIALTHNSNDEAYIAYVDATDDILYVKKQVGTSWVNVGIGISPAISPTMPVIAIDPATEHPWVAYVDDTSRIDVFRFDGTSWISEGVDVGAFTPEIKLMLEISPTSQPVLATQNAATNYLNIYKKKTGVWDLEADISINSGSFDLVTYNTIAYGQSSFLNSRRNILLYFASYYSSSNIWQAITYERVEDLFENLFNEGLAATSQGQKVLYDYYEDSNANPKLRLSDGVDVLGGASGKRSILSLAYSAVDENYYAMFLNSTDNLLVQQYIESIDTWVATSINIGVTGTASKAKMDCSSSGTKLHVAYIDSNNKIAIKEFLPAAPSVVYVDADATGNNDGTSWLNAYTTLDEGIANTNNLSSIWVAEGTYKPTTGTGREATFLVDKVISIYGGFNGSESNVSDRDPLNNKTILSGDLNGDDSTAITETEATRQDNTYHVLTLKGNIVSGGVIDGFTITGGNANGSISNNCSTASTAQYHHERGAAIYANPDGTNRTINMQFNNCIIEKNAALGMAVYYVYSPCGIRYTSADVNFESCIVRDNYSVDYSMFYYGGSGTYNNTRYGSLINCLIYDNYCRDDASVITMSTDGTVTAAKVDIINTTITKNTSGVGTTIKMNNASNSEIVNSIIYDNGSSTSIDISAGTQATVGNCIIEGGQLSASSSDPLFTNVTNDDYTLTTGSPAIDVGDNSFIPSSTTSDLLGNQRIFNTTVDMGAYEFGSSVLGIEGNLIKDNVIVYPNPVHITLNIQLRENLDKIQVYSILGRKVLESTISSINVSGLPSGMYLLKVYTQDGKIGVKRFLKQ